MSASKVDSPPSLDPIVNDFVVKFANVNGSGSASANSMFAKAIFRMGIPVSPRNIFPRISKACQLGMKSESVKQAI